MSKPKVISLFSGAGGMDLGFINAGFEVVWAIDFEPDACETYSKNIGDHIVCEDIIQVKTEDLPDCDIIIGGSPCFPKGQKVITKEGFKNIEDIQKEDLVLTHKGRYRRVVTPMNRKYSGNLYSIRPTYYNFRIEATNEHPFYTQRGWVAAKELKTDDYLSMPLNKESIIPNQIQYEQKINKHKVIEKETNLPLDSEYFWNLIGYWLAEGWTRDKRNGKDSRNTYQVFLASTEEKYKYISFVLENLDLHYLLLKGKSCDKIKIGNKELWMYVKQFTTGTKAHEKIIPEFVQDLPLNLARAFVEGFKNGDGNENDDRVRYSSTSLSLLESLQRLLLKTEKAMYSLGQSSYKRECTIEGRVVNARDSYALEKIKSDNKFAYFTDDYVFYKVRNINIEPVEDTDVYNFEVDEDNSYCLPITTVHNCQGFSNANRQTNFLDNPKNLMVREYIRVVKDKQPKVFVLENVPRLLTAGKGKFLNEIKEQLSNYHIEVKVLNAVDHGVAQKRRRAILIGSLIGEIKHPSPKKDSLTIRDVLSNLSDDLPNQNEYRASRDSTIEKIKLIKQGENVHSLPALYNVSPNTHVNVYRRLNLDEPSHTLAHAGKTVMIHPTEDRIISIREAARIQSFPDDFVFEGDLNSKYQQLANAVPPKMAEEIAKEISKHLHNE